jgi:transcriptional regulator with XRE-family HTH domain
MSADNYPTQHTELRVHLLRQGLSQRGLAKQLGITVQYLNDVLHGRRNGKPIRARLAAEFGIPHHLIRQYHQHQEKTEAAAA